MPKKNPYTIIYVIIAAIAIFAVSLIGFNFFKNGNSLFSSQSTNKDFPLDLDILGTLKLSYSDTWQIKNNGTDGVELTKGDVTILLTTAKVTNGSTLDGIVDQKNEQLKSSKKILSDIKITINSIPFRRLELGNLDETLFPSDGLISYSGIVNNNVYLSMIINFPSGGNPTEAESLIKTIRYN